MYSTLNYVYTAPAFPEAIAFCYRSALGGWELSRNHALLERQPLQHLC